MIAPEMIPVIFFDKIRTNIFGIVRTHNMGNQLAGEVTPGR
jgi:hypothetical protein